MVENLYGDRLGAGAVVGSYLIDELAVEGGFAALYRGRHLENGSPAAIKVLRSALSDSTKMLVRFHREAESIRALDHDHIVALFEVGELDDGRPFIAMEWLPGRNLRDELAARGPLTPREALSVMVEVGAALSAAHERGIVHRDVKAQNIMALPAGDWFTTKLVDFGIAKVRTPAGVAALTTMTVLGTPQTTAPEQLLGGEVNARTDIYGLGVLLYQLLTGRLPFDGTSRIELEEMHLYQDPPRASDLVPIAPTIDAVIARAMAKAQRDRFESVEQFVDALSAAIDGRAAARALAPIRGVGLWVTASIPRQVDADQHDGLLEAADSLLAMAERRAAQCSLSLALSTADAVLAVAPASIAPHETVLDLGRAIARESREIPGAELLELTIRVHSDELVLADPSCAARPSGGALLQPASWPASSLLDAVPTQ